MKNMKSSILLSLLIFAMVSGCSWFGHNEEEQKSTKKQPPPVAPAPAPQAKQPAAKGAEGEGLATSQDMRCEFRLAMRSLWQDHITWTRLYIVSAIHNLPDKDAAAARLMKNQEDIGNAIKPFYGEAAGNQLTALLKEHIKIATQIVDAALVSDKEAQDEATKRWEQNADELAMFLSNANPQNWHLEDMKGMLREHLNITIAEVTARLNDDWNADVKASDDLHKQAMKMADALAIGIMNQFPNKFI